MESFALSPIPTLAVWISDALNGVSGSLFWRSIEWRDARQKSPRWWFYAIVDLAILGGLIFAVCLWAGLVRKAGVK